MISMTLLLCLNSAWREQLLLECDNLIPKGLIGAPWYQVQRSLMPLGIRSGGDLDPKERLSK